MLRGSCCLLGALVAFTLSASARAETHRLAIVVGNNAGGGGQVALRFAEADADKVARTLVELGGIAPSDLFLLQGRGVGDLSRALDAAAARVADWHRLANSRVLVFFYFSGHSDGQSLELGADRLSFQDLRERAARLGADVRLLIVDSCRSGSLLRSKGATRVQPFDIHLADDLPKSGEAVITSSAADEASLESEEIRGSFFTHHLVSGLHGPADVSGDGRVGLGEAYEYAFNHTMMATADTLRGVQHPSYDYRLSGEGELVLTELYAHSAAVTVPDGYRRVLVTELRSDQIVAELTNGARVRLALRPGVYDLKVWKNDRLSFGRITLAEQEDRVLDEGDLTEARGVPGTAKGPAIEDGALILVRSSTPPARPQWFAALGVTSGVTGGLGQSGAAHVGLRSPGASGFELMVDGALRSAATFEEYRSVLLGGYRIGVVHGPLSASVAARVGAGVVGQRTANDATPTAFAAGMSPAGDVTWWMSRHLALDVEVDLLVAVYRRDFKVAASIWPAAFLGVVGSP